MQMRYVWRRGSCEVDMCQSQSRGQTRRFLAGGRSSGELAVMLADKVEENVQRCGDDKPARQRRIDAHAVELCGQAQGPLRAARDGGDEGPPAHVAVEVALARVDGVHEVSHLAQRLRLGPNVAGGRASQDEMHRRARILLGDDVGACLYVAARREDGRVGRHCPGDGLVRGAQGDVLLDDENFEALRVGARAQLAGA